MKSANSTNRILIQKNASYGCDQLIQSVSDHGSEKFSLYILRSITNSSSFFVDKFEHNKVINILKDTSLNGITKQIKDTLGEIDIFIHCLGLQESEDLENQIFSVNESYWHGRNLGVSKFAYVFIDKKAEDIKNERLEILAESIKTLEKANERSAKKREFLQIYLDEEEIRLANDKKILLASLVDTIVRPLTSYTDLSSHPSLLSQRADLMKTSFSFMESEALATALAVRLFEYLGSSPKTLDTICLDLKLEKAVLRDLLDILVTIGVIQKNGAETYNNTLKASTYLIEGKPGYLGHYILQIWRDWIDRWHNKLLPALTNKHEKNSSTRENLLSTQHPRTDWASAMECLSSSWAKLLAEKHDFWSKHSQVLDLGSSRGLVSAIIGSQNSHLKFELVDIAENSNDVDSLMSKFPLMSNRYHFTQSDISGINTLPKADVILLGHFLHGFDEKSILQIIKKCAASLPPNGALVIVEYFIDKNRSSHLPGLLMSLNMRLYKDNKAQDFTIDDLQNWIKETSLFSEDKTMLRLTDEHSALIFYKN